MIMHTLMDISNKKVIRKAYDVKNTLMKPLYSHKKLSKVAIKNYLTK